MRKEDYYYDYITGDKLEAIINGLPWIVKGREVSPPVPPSLEEIKNALVWKEIRQEHRDQLMILILEALQKLVL